MFKSFRTGTKLLILCGAFLISIAVPIYALVTEKQIAIAFARKELAGSRYLATVRDIYAAILAVGSGSAAPASASHDALLQKLADAQARAHGRFETAEFAQALSRALGELWSHKATGAPTDALLLDALAKAQTLAWRIGDDSNLALDPDLDTYYVQHIVVRVLPALLGQLAELQDDFQSSIAAGPPSPVHAARLPVLASLVRATASEVKDNLAAAYRGNADGGLQRAVDGAFAATISSIESYLGAIGVSTSGVDARDTAQSDRFHARAVQGAIEAWALAQRQLDRLLHRRIDGFLANMWLGLALIGALAGLSIAVAVLTHRHIVRPLERLEAVASTVRETKDYSRRVDYTSQDEIGRVAAAFNDMLAELAAARTRETAERAELARVTRLTTMGEMAASIAHEVNQPLAAIVANGNAGLRWLAKAPPDMDKAGAALQRVVRDGLRASEVVGSVRGMFKRDVQHKAPVVIDALIEEALAHVQGELQSEAIALEVDLAPGLPRVLADRVQLQQVLLNLIANAIDAMRAGQDCPRRLRVRAGAGEANSVSIAVEDSGAGIAPGDKERIFDAFFTTKASGMGLGLAICRSIIEAHGGRLAVSAAMPRGTIFELTLPTCEAGER